MNILLFLGSSVFLSSSVPKFFSGKLCNIEKDAAIRSLQVLRQTDLEQVFTITQDEVVERCKRGDTSAFTQLYHQYSKEVYNTIFRLVPHTGEAEDLLQEVFVSAFQAIHKFENTGGFRAWVKRIAINQSISWIRKQKKLKMVELDDTKTGFAEEESIDEAHFSFKVEEVKRAIEELPDTYRTIVQLYLFENIPQEEIAIMLGISYNNVRIQYHRSKQKILKSISEGGFV
ncbi:RNA polymerase sigma factor [Sediminibacterium goheungense]|uniref:RNA polymerase sigma-70 factor (ECF subfamily) n=1 Tax=Sediminibacterium goheungense TaxID=1086393 RepID=A0A4V3C5D0_9BACT|nr:RNA polymerase sigma factor [Sediminibacterium goheungense]TDO29388.1 RNA polymerase sigma-70 factor (ECF subfamily) [Sediminibacterium goheungense]